MKRSEKFLVKNLLNNDAAGIHPEIVQFSDKDLIDLVGSSCHLNQHGLHSR